jgi:sensor domain CHASE-containing protein
MDFPRIRVENMPIEDRVEKIACLVLVALLYATLGGIV